jgi:hypothetical protein
MFYKIHVYSYPYLILYPIMKLNYSMCGSGQKEIKFTHNVTFRSVQVFASWIILWWLWHINNCNMFSIFTIVDMLQNVTTGITTSYCFCLWNYFYTVLNLPLSDSSIIIFMIRPVETSTFTAKIMNPSLRGDELANNCLNYCTSSVVPTLISVFLETNLH